MNTQTKEHRRDPRHSIAREANAYVELTGPDGVTWRWPMVDLSVAGLAFVTLGENGGLEPGLRFDDARIALGDCLVVGGLLVLYVSRRSETETYCGCLFYPASAAQQEKLAHAVAGLEIAERA